MSPGCDRHRTQRPARAPIRNVTMAARAGRLAARDVATPDFGGRSVSRWKLRWGMLAVVAALVCGCSGKDRTAGTAGSAGPSLDSKNADERAAAAREAAKKYGAEK